MLANKGYDGKKADVWSCGVILFVLLAGYLPFEEATMVALFKKIKHAEFTYPSWFTEDAKHLISQILIPDPEVRISLAEINNSEWLNKPVDVPPPSVPNAANRIVPREEDDDGDSGDEKPAAPKPPKASKAPPVPAAAPAHVVARPPVAPALEAPVKAPAPPAPAPAPAPHVASPPAPPASSTPKSAAATPPPAPKPATTPQPPPAAPASAPAAPTSSASSGGAGAGGSGEDKKKKGFFNNLFGFGK